MIRQVNVPQHQLHTPLASYPRPLTLRPLLSQPHHQCSSLNLLRICIPSMSSRKTTSPTRRLPCPPQLKSQPIQLPSYPIPHLPLRLTVEHFPCGYTSTALHLLQNLDIVLPLDIILCRASLILELYTCIISNQITPYTFLNPILESEGNQGETSNRAVGVGWLS